jgi:hypothetical protein
MSTGRTHGTLTVSVDLEHNHIDVGLAEQRALETVATELVEMFTRYEMPVTWGVADPAISAARARIDVSRRGHELALLGDTTWVGREAGRSRFARELTRRTARARSEGLTLRTLALRTPLPVDHCDLAIKEGILAARQPLAESSRAARPLHPQTLRFGLWGFPISISLPGTSRWLPGGGGTRAARYQIDRAITERGTVHLAIDAPHLAERGPSALRVVERVLEHATRRRQHGLLELSTIGAIAGRLTSEHQGQPSRSILRPAA